MTKAKAKKVEPVGCRNGHAMHEIAFLIPMIGSDIMPVGGPLDGVMSKTSINVWDPLTALWNAKMDNLNARIRKKHGPDRPL